MDLPESLYREGSCRGTDPDIFNERSDKYDPIEAKKICAGCSVAETCLQFATELPFMIEQESTHYVWGGMTESERSQLTEAKQY